MGNADRSVTIVFGAWAMILFALPADLWALPAQTPADVVSRISSSPTCSARVVTGVCYCGAVPCAYRVSQFVPASFIETTRFPGESMLAGFDLMAMGSSGAAALAQTRQTHANGKDSTYEVHVFSMPERLVQLHNGCQSCKISSARVPAQPSPMAAINMCGTEMLSTALGAAVEGSFETLGVTMTPAYLSELDFLNWRTGCRDLTLQNLFERGVANCAITASVDVGGTLVQSLEGDPCIGAWGPLYPRQMRSLGPDEVRSSAIAAYRGMSVARTDLGNFPFPVDIAGKFQQAYPAVSSCVQAGAPGALADRYRVEVADVRQTLYVVWRRVGKLSEGAHTQDREAYFKYLYRSLVNELSDSIGVHPTESFEDYEVRRSASPQGDADAHVLVDFPPDDHNYSSAVPPVDEQIRMLFIRCCSEIAFPDAVRAHPLYNHPSYRSVLDGILAQESTEKIAARMGVTKRRVNSQMEDIYHLFSAPDAGRIDRIFRALPEEQWLPSSPITRRALRSLRLPNRMDRSGTEVLKALRQFVCLGVQPAIVYVDQYSRVLQCAEVCVAARILGLESVATLLHVVASDSSDIDDLAFRTMCGAMRADHTRPPQLIPAFQKLYDEGSLSPLVAAFFDEMPASAQFLVLRELGTTVITTIGSTEAQALLSAAREGVLLSSVRLQLERSRERIGRALKMNA